MSLLSALCMSVLNGKPYLSQLAPLVAPCREQWSNTAQAGGVTSSGGGPIVGRPFYFLVPAALVACGAQTHDFRVSR